MKTIMLLCLVAGLVGCGGQKRVGDYAHSNLYVENDESNMFELEIWSDPEPIINVLQCEETDNPYDWDTIWISKKYVPARPTMTETDEAWVIHISTTSQGGIQ